MRAICKFMHNYASASRDSRSDLAGGGDARARPPARRRRRAPAPRPSAGSGRCRGLANRRTSTGSPAVRAQAPRRRRRSAKSSLSRSARITADAAGPGQLDRRDRQAEDGAQVKLELVGRLADQRDHAGVVRARAQLGEDRLVAGDEEFDAENAVAAERGDDLAPPAPAPMRAPPASIAAGCQLSR